MAKPPPLDRYHLTKDAGKGDWALKKEGAGRATRRFESKAEATKGGVLKAAVGSGSVRIHKQDGVIQEERTFPRSRDPKKSKG